MPAWTTLTEVNEGNTSAAHLGLTTTVVPVHNQPGFGPGQVVSTDPPAGTLARLVDAVEVKVNVLD